jgi:hypothetical protein
MEHNITMFDRGERKTSYMIKEKKALNGQIAFVNKVSLKVGLDSIRSMQRSIESAAYQNSLKNS